MRGATAGIAAALWSLHGCNAVSLDQVAIDGGTEDQRQAAREALLAFDAWVGQGRVRIAGLSFAPLPDGVGRYMRPERIVVVDADTPADEVRVVVRHELCHALDYAHHLAAEQKAALDVLGARLDAVRNFGKSHDALRREAFAVACEMGPLAAHLLAKPCPGDDALASALAPWLADRVWSQVEVHPALEGPPTAFLPPVSSSWWTGPAVSVQISATTTPGVVWVAVSDPDITEAWPVVRDTGELFDGVVEIAPPDPLFLASPPQWGVGWPLQTGGASTTVRLAIAMIGTDWLGDRQMLTEAAGWAPIRDGCFGDPATVFLSDGELWTGDLAASGAISWRPLHVGPDSEW